MPTLSTLGRRAGAIAGPSTPTIRRDRVPRTGGALLLALLALAWLPTEAEAIPRYSVRYRQDCSLCHQNPAGGGQRSAYAAQYLVPAEMVMFPWSDEKLERIDPQLGENLSAGADLRLQYFEGYEPAGFFLMQGDLYLSFSIDDRNLLYLEQGIRESYDLYGLSYGLPLDGHVKLGRFTPSFGWRFADHTRFVREKLHFTPPAHTDVGVELGIQPGETTINVALMNGSAGSLLDADSRPALFGRVSQRLSLASLGISAGLSFLANDAGAARRAGGGPFGSLHWGRLSWLGEADAVRYEDDTDAPQTELVITQELAWQLRPGLDLIGVYDFYDPDVDLATGKESALSLGLDLLPQPYLQLKALVRAWRDEEDEILALLQAHFMY